MHYSDNIKLISTLERDRVTGLSECFFFFDFLFFRLRLSPSLMISGVSSLVFFLYLYSESLDSYTYLFATNIITLFTYTNTFILSVRKCLS